MGRDGPEGYSLLGSDHASPIAENRPARDRGWAWALITLYIGSLVGGVTAYSHLCVPRFTRFQIVSRFLFSSLTPPLPPAPHSNPEFFKINEKYLADASHCPAPSPSGARALLDAGDDPPPFDASDFASHAAAWLAISAAASTLLAAGFLHLVRHHARALTRATVAFQLAVPTAVALGLALSGALGQSLVAGAFAGLTYLVFYLWRRELGVAASLMAVAGHGLAENASLIGFTLLLNGASVALAVPPFVGAAAGFAVGDVAPNPARGGRAACVDEFGDGVACCAWQPRPAAAAYTAVAALVGVWTMLTLNQVRVFTVSGAVARWYFAPPGASTAGHARTALRQAVTSSLGTCAFGGAVLTLTQAVKRQQQEDAQAGRVSIFGLLASCMASLYEYLTKFATVMAAVTGEGLTAAGRRATDLLLRSALEAFATTIWFPQAILQLVSVTLAAAWGAAVWAGYRYLHAPGGEEYPATNAIVLGALVGVVTLFVLSFVAGVLLAVLDAVFICFALDRDRAAVSNAALYGELLGAVQERGVLVVEPDGGMEYGQAQGMAR